MFNAKVTAAIVFVCALAGPARAAESLKSMPPGPKPFPVTVGTYLIDFDKIDEQTLTHTIVGYLTLEWKDPRLAKGLAPDLDRDAVTLEQIWSPNIEFTNQHTPRETANSQVSIADDGTVKYEERFKAELATDFDLVRFPFDQQMLLVQIESFQYDASQVVLIERTMRELKSPDSFLPDWFIGDVSQQIDTDTNNPDRALFSRYTFDIPVARKRGYYVWNVFMPLGFITFLAWAVFFINPEDVATRAGVSITALLTAIAFSLVISGTRPRVSYLTFMDAIFLNAYFMIFITAVAAVYGHFLIRASGSNQSAEKFSRLGQRAFPVLVLLSNAVLALNFLL